MSTIKSSTEHLTLNADGSGKDIKFQANGVEKASISSAGAFTSTSIDATKLSGALPAIDGSALTGVGGGKVLQVVNATYSAQVINSTTTYADTGLTATITPTLATSTILVIVNQNGCMKNANSANNGLAVQLLRGATSISVLSLNAAFTNTASINYLSSTSTNYLDSPATTAATTYKVQFKNASATADVRVQENGATSTITLMEIGV